MWTQFVYVIHNFDFVKIIKFSTARCGFSKTIKLWQDEDPVLTSSFASSGPYDL